MSKELYSLAKKAVEYGWLKDCSESVDGLALGILSDQRNATWRDVAHFCSRYSGGQWLYFEQGAFWNYTGKRGWIVDPLALGRIEAARTLCHSVTGVLPAYSVGAAARELLKFACPPDKVSRHAPKVLVSAGIGYNECKPGTYEDMQYLDVKSAYFQIVSRLPSLHWRVDDEGTFHHQDLDKNSALKWKHVLEAIASNKGLRNSVWGSMMGSMHPTEYFCDGRQEVREPWHGNYEAAGMLTARIGWEFNIAAAYETDAVYAQTDCVVCKQGITPKVWDNFNLAFKREAKGSAEIIRQANYRVGTKSTENYKDGYRWVEPNPRKPLPSRWYCNEVLEHVAPIEINW